MAVWQLLVPAGAVDQIITASGCTPLWFSSWKGHIEIVKALLSARANADKAQTVDGCTPLYAA